MRILDFTVPKEYDGVNLKSFLRGYCGVSAHLLTKLKQQPNGIRVNGEHQTVLVTLNAGNLVQLTISEEGNWQNQWNFHFLYVMRTRILFL